MCQVRENYLETEYPGCLHPITLLCQAKLQFHIKKDTNFNEYFNSHFQIIVTITTLNYLLKQNFELYQLF